MPRLTRPVASAPQPAASAEWKLLGKALHASPSFSTSELGATPPPAPAPSPSPAWRHPLLAPGVPRATSVSVPGMPPNTLKCMGRGNEISGPKCQGCTWLITSGTNSLLDFSHQLHFLEREVAEPERRPRSPDPEPSGSIPAVLDESDLHLFQLFSSSEIKVTLHRPTTLIPGRRH